MRIVSFSCDNCKKEVKEFSDLTHISLYVNLGEDRRPHHSIEICEECANELGFIEPKNDKNYIKNYGHLVKNMFSIVKKILRRD